MTTQCPYCRKSIMLVAAEIHPGDKEAQKAGVSPVRPPRLERPTGFPDACSCGSRNFWTIRKDGTAMISSQGTPYIKCKKCGTFWGNEGSSWGGENGGR
jgi:hypothetical protein